MKADELEKLSLELNAARESGLDQIDGPAMRALEAVRTLRRPKGDEFGDEYNDPRDSYSAEIGMLIDELADWAEFLRKSAGK